MHNCSHMHLPDASCLPAVCMVVSAKDGKPIVHKDTQRIMLSHSCMYTEGHRSVLSNVAVQRSLWSSLFFFCSFQPVASVSTTVIVLLTSLHIASYVEAESGLQEDKLEPSEQLGDLLRQTGDLDGALKCYRSAGATNKVIEGEHMQIRPGPSLLL